MRRWCYVLVVLFFCSCGDENHSGDKGKGNSSIIESVDTVKIESLKLTVSKEPVRFDLTCLRDTLLSLENGKLVYMPENLFDTKDSVIQITIKEVDNYFDMISSHVDCRSDDKILETGGMLHLEAKDGSGKILSVKKGKDYVLHFPKNDKSKDMQLFLGNNVDDNVNWSLDNQNLLASNLEITGWSYIFPQEDTIRKLQFQEPSKGGYFKYIKRNLKYTKSDLKSLPNEGIGYTYCLKRTGEVESFKFMDPKGLSLEDKIRKLYMSMPRLRYPIPETINHGKFCASETIGIVQSAPKYMSNQAYKNSFKTKYAQYEKQGIKNIKEAELKYYIFESNNIGWINCDRFVNWPNEKIAMDVQYKDVEYDSLDTYFVFANIKSMMQGYEKESTSTFYNLPETAPGFVVTLAYKGSGLLMNVTETNIQKDPVIVSNLEKVTLEYVQEKLLALEGKSEELVP